MKHYKILIKGHVQKVGFRYYTRKKAQALGLTGFTENRRDGSVYIEAEGNPAALDEFAEWCRTGPPLAEVTETEILPGEPAGYADFVIREGLF